MPISGSKFRWAYFFKPTKRQKTDNQEQQQKSEYDNNKAGDIKMKIAIPTEEDKESNKIVAEHFGRCDSYTIVDEKGDIIEIIQNTSEHMGGKGLPPEILKKHDVEILLCRGLGPRAIKLCNNYGIDVYVAEAETVKDIFELWQSNSLKKAGLDDVCEEHKI